MKSLLDEILVDRGQHAEKFREKIAFEVLFEGRDAKELAEEYQLAGVYTVNNWVAKYRERIKSELVTLPPMNEKEKGSVNALKMLVRELEKAFEYANVLI